MEPTGLGAALLSVQWQKCVTLQSFCKGGEKKKDLFKSPRLNHSNTKGGVGGGAGVAEEQE